MTAFYLAARYSLHPQMRHAPPFVLHFPTWSDFIAELDGDEPW